MTNIETPKVTIMEPDGGERIALPGFGAVLKLLGRDDGGELGIVEHPFAAGTIVAPHRHTREDEHSIVIEGRIGFRSDDQEVVLEAGGIITKPRGQTHSMWNAGPVPGRILELITPGGFEIYFRELGALLSAVDLDGSATPGSHMVLHDRADFASLAARYHITYENPDWLADVIDRYGLNPPSH